jgi:hypothetical protein
MPRELHFCCVKLLLLLRALLRGTRALLRDLDATLLAGRRFRFGALASSRRVPLPLLGHRHLTADSLHLLALRAHEARELVPLRFRRCACTVCLIARDL